MITYFNSEIMNKRNFVKIALANRGGTLAHIYVKLIRYICFLKKINKIGS